MRKAETYRNSHHLYLVISNSPFELFGLISSVMHHKLQVLTQYLSKSLCQPDDNSMSICQSHKSQMSKVEGLDQHTLLNDLYQFISLQSTTINVTRSNAFSKSQKSKAGRDQIQSNAHSKLSFFDIFFNIM